MTNPRPVPVGIYDILQDFECPTASVRVFRMASPAEAIGGHAHRRSMQIYVAIEGEAIISIDGVESRLRPFEAVAVWPGAVHSATPAGTEAVLMNISVPPLAADDQAATPIVHEPPDMRLPHRQGDIDEWGGPGPR